MIYVYVDSGTWSSVTKVLINISDKELYEWVVGVCVYVCVWGGGGEPEMEECHMVGEV